MGKSATNIAVILGLVTIAVGLYYLYSQYNNGGEVSVENNEQVRQAALDDTLVFIQRSEALNSIAFDKSIFTDERFLSLHKFSTEVETRPIGRPDPFADVNR